jgi:peptidoglycan/xylan/chitin deacetylase (PgdA/CDA1 family)
MVTAAVMAVALLLGAAVWASADVGSGVWVRALCRAGGARRAVALTFDDGPHPELTPRVLDLLRRHGAQATFFVVGKNAEAHPDLVRRMVAEGHTVGNHTYAHSPRFPLMGAARMREDMERCDAVMEEITGSRPALFRPPLGVTNPTLARALGKGRMVAGWSVRSLDTVARWSREMVFKRVRRRLRPGAVVLLHDDREGAPELLEMILNHLERDGYVVERFDKLFGL